MQFIEPTLPAFLAHLKNLSADKQPLWGSMSPQRMVEHIADVLHLSVGKYQLEQLIPENKVEKAQAFLKTEHPMPKNFKVPFATPETPLRNQSLDEAIEEFSNAWKTAEKFFEENPGVTTLHPSFGQLNYDQWLLLHSKHFSHHFEQFGI